MIAPGGAFNLPTRGRIADNLKSSLCGKCLNNGPAWFTQAGPLCILFAPIVKALAGT